MAKRLLKDATIIPTSKIIADGLKDANNTYLCFTEELCKQNIF